MVDSLLDYYLPEQYLAFWMTYDVPRGLGYFVDYTTEGFGKYIPGLVERYGPD